ncbi:RNA polymerase sigma factor [Foetidibacter luteolus]|uniref:RNA polymerase sigma factor n=1 Tax=Foetidibacter luteolus TaxID=2608880 RepID=UPI00129AC785|nr:sigma-70 family RNA polymerase sigma factor [Foetidibacter luteolus]
MKELIADNENHLGEHQLLKQLHSGNENALFSLMMLYYADLFKYAVKFLRNPDTAKDIINQFFVHVWDRREKLAEVVSVKNYLVVSFRHFLLKHLEMMKREKESGYNYLQTEALAEQSFEEYAGLHQKDAALSHALQQAISALPERQKQLVQLRFYEQLSCDEIAEKTSLNIRTVYNKLHEAISRLRSPELVSKLKKIMFSALW